MSDQNLMYSSSGVSAFTGDPFVLLTWGHESAQMTPDEARAFALHIINAADTAENDALIVKVLQEVIETSHDAALMVLGIMRDRRKDTGR